MNRTTPGLLTGRQWKSHQVTLEVDFFFHFTTVQYISVGGHMGAQAGTFLKMGCIFTKQATGYLCHFYSLVWCHLIIFYAY